MKTAIIFGSNGQDGHYLIPLLTKQNIQVTTSSRSNSDFNGTVSNYQFVEGLIQKIKPTYIFHLAASSTTSHNALFDNHDSISTGSINILESVRLHSPDSKVFISGSAMQFKNSGTPIDEDTEFEASSAYSLSRIHSTYAARYYREKFGIKTYVGYFFNHDSPLRSTRHVNQKVAAYVLSLESDPNQPPLEIGNMDVKKEFNFAGDVCSAIWMLVNQESVTEAVIGSGEAYSIKDWIEYCFKTRGLDWKKYVKETQNFKAEYDILVCSPKRIKSIGWQPQVSFTQLADMMLNKE